MPHVTETLDQFRSAMRFSLWTWAAYWPGCGLVLLAGGMTDPTSLVVALLAVAGFLAVMATGFLEAPTTSRLRVRDWVVDRPIYLLVFLVLAIVAGSFIEGAPNVAFFLFSGLYVGGLVLAMVRLRSHLRATEGRVFAAKADQVFLLLGLMSVLGTVVFLDTFLASGVGIPSSIGAVLNLVNLSYPWLLLVAAKPFRAKLRLPVRITAGRAPVDAVADE